MIYFVSKQRVQEGLAGWLLTAATRLDGDKDCVNLCQPPWIVKSHHPPAIGFVIHVKNSQIGRRCLLALRRLFLAPYLERLGIHNPWLAIQIESIKDQRLALRVENSAEGLSRTAAAVNIEDVGDVEFPRAHQFANVAVGSQILLGVLEPALLIAIDGVKFFDPGFERVCEQNGFVVLATKAYEFSAKALVAMVRFLKLGI